MKFLRRVPGGDQQAGDLALCYGTDVLCQPA
jgi:hypothetical protein